MAGNKAIWREEKTSTLFQESLGHFSVHARVLRGFSVASYPKAVEIRFPGSSEKIAPAANALPRHLGSFYRTFRAMGTRPICRGLKKIRRHKPCKMQEARK